MIEQIQPPMVASRAQHAATGVARQLNTRIRAVLGASTDATLNAAGITVATAAWAQRLTRAL